VEAIDYCNCGVLLVFRCSREAGLRGMERVVLTSIIAVDDAKYQGPHEHDDNGWPAVIIGWGTAPDCCNVVPIDLDDVVEGNLQDWNSKANSQVDCHLSSLR